MIEAQRIKDLIKKLNEANKAYYQENKEIISNYEYDKLYNELEQLEKQTGIVYSNSPTKNVGYKIISSLPKERHESPMLSLDKTKSISELKDWLGEHKGLISWKLDGLTIVLTYNNGELEKAITRGNGEVGEVITNNAKVFKNIPINIGFKGKLIIRGEAVIKYSDFNKINETLSEEEQYKNPRNLCSGTVRQLNNEITAKRNVHFFAFQLVEASDIDIDSKYEQLKWLSNLGFEVVESKIVSQDILEDTIFEFEKKISNNDFGSDGLVLTYDSSEFSESLGRTSKFPRHSIAFKWKDEVKETTLIDILWSASRTGLINPVAIFEPIELEGTTVSRASVHNISILEDLELGKGDTIKVYKANMIIPQIADNVTRSNSITIPKKCPECNELTEIRQINDVKSLYCNNIDCPAKKLKAISHYVSRDAMNIEGFSEATIKKFIDKGFLNTIGDIYRLDNYKDEIISMEGFGEKSYNNLVSSIEKSKTANLANFIYSLGIIHVGLSNAKLLCKYYDNNFNKILEAKSDELVKIEGFGEKIAKSIESFFNLEKNIDIVNDLLQYINFVKESSSSNELLLEGKTFVITGSLELYENRKTLKNLIEGYGGKVTNSVTSKTDYLINNNITSTSSKNKKAKELDIPIINEQQFQEMLGI